MRIFSIIAIAIFTITNAYAYVGETRIGLYKDDFLDTDKVTHIIVVGSGVKEDSNQFFQTGVARAEKYKQLNPDEQVVIMSSPEVRGTDDEKVFTDFNVPVVEVIKETFKAELLLIQLAKYTKIASIDFYAHSSPWAIKLGKSDAAFDPQSHEKELKAIKQNFLKHAYVTINSCSSGFSIAPDLSRILELPVSGSLTSSLFERIESDGLFYKEDDWTQSNWVEINPASFNEDMSCKLGFCYRMKPSQYSYYSYWGQFKEGGLNFYKFFCNFEKNKDGRCEIAMAKSLLATPSIKNITTKSSVEDFKVVAFDQLCPTYKDKSRYAKCVEGITSAIERGDNIFQTMPGPELNCDFHSCNANVVCKEKKLFGKGPKPGTCHLNVVVQPNPTNAANEMLSYLKGFKLLKQF
jgi:hypothetical protein